MLMVADRLPDAEVSVLLIGDEAMRTLNRRYRGKDRTTDVLSFPLREGTFSVSSPSSGRYRYLRSSRGASGKGGR